MRVLEGPRAVLIPLFALYAVSLLVLQTPLAQNGGVILVLKLILGICILGGFSIFILGKQAQISHGHIDAMLILASVSFGATLLFLTQFLNTRVFRHVDSIPGLNYYQFDQIPLPILLLIITLLAVYVYTEELFFTGVTLNYFASIAGASMSLVLTAIVFTAAHLNPSPGLLCILILLSINNILMRRHTGTFLYGFVAHATLDVSAVLFYSHRIAPFNTVPLTPALSIAASCLLAFLLIAILSKRKNAVY